MAAPQLAVRRFPLAVAALASVLLLAGCAPGSGPIEDYPGLPVIEEEIVITREEQPVAKLVGSRPARKPRQPGSGKGMLTSVSDDDEHLEDFKEYMP